MRRISVNHDRLPRLHFPALLRLPSMVAFGGTPSGGGVFFINLLLGCTGIAGSSPDLGDSGERDDNLATTQKVSHMLSLKRFTSIKTAKCVFFLDFIPSAKHSTRFCYLLGGSHYS